VGEMSDQQEEIKKELIKNIDWAIEEMKKLKEENNGLQQDIAMYQEYLNREKDINYVLSEKNKKLIEENRKLQSILDFINGDIDLPVAQSISKRKITIEKINVKKGKSLDP
jgi:predicted nuclease with TOPRIM domain